MKRLVNHQTNTSLDSFVRSATMLDKPKSRGRRPGTSPKRWSQSDTDKLIEYANAGMGSTVIARLLNRSVTAIDGRKHRLGLPPQYPQRINGYVTDRVAWHLSCEQFLLERFRNFCHDRGASMAPTIETLIEAFMNQVEEAEDNAESAEAEK
jgi:hypothetical protein